MTENQSTAAATPICPDRTIHQMARVILFAFLLTFIAARILVLLIMTKRVPTLYLHMSGTHVHHLNYGIFLLSAVGALLLLVRPTGKKLTLTAVLYGIGLALTFDEFGMWLHLGGAYWQRASFDAVVVIAAILTLITEVPRIQRLRQRHFVGALILAGSAIVFALLLRDALRRYADISPALQQIEANGPQ